MCITLPWTWCFKMRTLLIVLILVFALKASEIAVVVSLNFEGTNLDKRSVSRIFLAKTVKINSVRIRVYEVKNTKYKQSFYKAVSGKSPAQLRAYWTTLIFTGKAKPAKQLNDINELIAKMKIDNKVISYVPLSEVTDEMKILYTMNE